MNHFIFIFAALLTLIVPPVNERITPKESGPTVNVLMKVAKIAPLPPVKAVEADSLDTIYIAPPVVEAPAPVAAPVADTSGGCGDNYMATYIYMHESGCLTNAIAPNGACGIGQAWPCSKMPCSLSDYACQNAFFTDYAVSRYGGWGGAYQHWLSVSWW